MQTKKARSEFIRLTSAARFLGVKNVTVRRWVRWRWLNGYKFGTQLIQVRVHDIQTLKRLSIEFENDMASQLDTRFGSILRDSPSLFGIKRDT